MIGTSTPDNNSRGGMDSPREISINTGHTKKNIFIKISDMGPGIPEKDLQYIFDPFFTRKKKMGMGVGLSICHRIIYDHGGFITGENLPHGGVMMTITLPAS